MRAVAKLATELATLREHIATERCRAAGVEPLPRSVN